METEFRIGSKMNKVFNDFESAHLLTAKSTAGPDFSFRETNTMFILCAHLKGYRGEDIKVEIVKYWTIIAISGEYLIKDSVRVGEEVIKNEIKMRRFKKAFRIPAGVVLNEIKARFNKYQSLLTILMPKMLKKFNRVVIEEVKADEFIHSDLSQQIKVDEVSDGDFLFHKEGITDQLPAPKATQEADQLPVREEIRTNIEGQPTQEADKLPEREEIRTNIEGQPTQEADQLPVREEIRTNIEGPRSKLKGRDVEESGELRGAEATQEAGKLHVGEETLRKHEEEETRRKEGGEVNNIDKSKSGDKPCSRKLCACCKFAGSALLVSLVVIVFHFIRSQNQSNTKKNKSKI